MPLIALLADTHFGVRQFNPAFQEHFLRFYREVFFPVLKKFSIKKVIHLGDFGDSPKLTSFSIMHSTRQQFLERLEREGIQMDVMVGNHDCFYRNTNEVNGVREMLAMYPNVRVFEEPTEVEVEGVPMLYVPWLNSSNTEAGLQTIQNSKARVLLGHLEIKGFAMYRGRLSDHGLDRNLLGHFDKVYSGHYHTRSTQGNIEYLGAPYEMTFQDAGDERVFHLFDTDTLKKKYVRNPFHIHERLIYDDRSDESVEELTKDFGDSYRDCFVKVVVLHKTRPAFFEEWMKRLEASHPASLNINEDSSLEIEAVETPEEEECLRQQTELLAQPTLTVLENYVDTISKLDVDRGELKKLFGQLYVDALHSAEQAIS